MKDGGTMKRDHLFSQTSKIYTVLPEKELYPPLRQRSG